MKGYNIYPPPVELVNLIIEIVNSFSLVSISNIFP